MANRRMISKSISVSEQVNSMSTFASLLFTWMIAHADDFGRMPGSPAKVKALVMPMRPESVHEVEKAIQEMVEQDLITWYEVSGVRYIQFNTWERHQTGLHKRTKSAFPDPAEGSEQVTEVPGISRSTEENLTELEQNLTELKDKEQGALVLQSAIEEVAATAPAERKDSSSSLRQRYTDIELGQIARAYQAEGFGQITPMVREKLIAMLEDFDFEWVSEAFLEAVTHKATTLAYVQTVLNNWRKAGRITRGETKPVTRREARAPNEPDSRYGEFYKLFPKTVG
ncbi:DnaD domain protein [Alicyclobacillus fastidiosus]|uniref:DnaD domain protein n=1 Tax=Alicyclobacillus fastidiosus TaxID=392011 RepID=A0ABY6ZIS0_9BACL|nr:DnaD domain protein [Alicyclobacillus fastidiosus]WAH42808.1 DnaD domain protein [Alicyclobacillus fastidiosus]GMA64731.1 hypothetical protein GCM10025859_51710 [Alicyclobacillus fastidiosus]